MNVLTMIIGRGTACNGLNVTSDVNNKVALNLYLYIDINEYNEQNRLKQEVG
jgi:hypothetical protein